MHSELPEGYTVIPGTYGKVIMTPQSFECSSTIKSLQHDTIVSLGRHVKTVSSMGLGLPADGNSAPALAILREDAQKQGRGYSFQDVLLIAEVAPASLVCENYDGCTAKYGRYGIPIYMVVDPYAGEVSVHTESVGTNYTAVYTYKYGTGKLPIELADGRTFTLDLNELP
ncbi:Uma2 family endonuclease [Streptomyces sp. NRRL B-1347]|uniref:Uma2 family endonuclease n=1 Tax=Streptomyces sp. NRRL B-1347 TaxID=1476877 RepID=UPI001F20FA3F|nr:Uma2 family endonuclease [Streptomyces sp. NRRL B-1347]